MAYNFEGKYAHPGISPAETTYEGQPWAGAKGYKLQAGGATIDGRSRDIGNTGQTTLLRAGLLMMKAAGSNTDQYAHELVPWTTTNEIYGILMNTVDTQRNGADANNLRADIMVGGYINTDEVIVPGAGEPAKGITGSTVEAEVRDELAKGNRFIQDDALSATYTLP